MIKLDFYEAIALYLSLLLFISLVYFVLTEATNTGNKKMPVDMRYLWHCGICMHTYVDIRGELFSRCPKCDSINQKKDSVKI